MKSAWFATSFLVLGITWMHPGSAVANHRPGSPAELAASLTVLADQSLRQAQVEVGPCAGRLHRRLLQQMLIFRDLSTRLQGALLAGGPDGSLPDDDDEGVPGPAGYGGASTHGAYVPDADPYGQRFAGYRPGGGPGHDCGNGAAPLVGLLYDQADRVEAALYRLPMPRTQYLWDQELSPVLRGLRTRVGLWPKSL